MDVEKVHALGIPRTDIFFDDKYKKETKRNLYKRYPKLKGKKVLLFAPHLGEMVKMVLIMILIK